MNRLQKIFGWAVCLLMFILPWQTRWLIKVGQLDGGANEYLTYSFYATDILLIILFLFYLILSLRAAKERRRVNLGLTVSEAILKKDLSPKQSEIVMSHSLLAMAREGRLLQLFAISFLIVCLLSIFFATDKLLAFFIFARLLLGFGLVFLIINFQDKLRLIWWLVLGLVWPAWLAVAQFLLQTTWANKWLGLAFHSPVILGAPVIEITKLTGQPERWLRAFGSFDHPNILGGTMAIGLLLAIFLLASWQGQKTRFNYRLILYLAIGSLSAGLFVSFSRAAWLGLGLGLGSWLILIIWRKRYQELKAWLLGTLIILLIFLFFFAPYHELAGIRLGGQGRLEQQSNTERLVSYSEAWQLIRLRPLFGIGLGNYTLALSKLIPEQPCYVYQPTHNVWLLVLAEVGLLGLLSLLGIFLSLLSRVIKTQNIFGLALLLVVIVMMQVDHWWWSLHFGIFFSLTILTLVYNFGSNNKQL